MLSKSEALQEVNSHMEEYLHQCGVKNLGRNFRCVLGTHEDKSPSMKYYPSTKRVKCFSCGFAGDLVEIHSKRAGRKDREFFRQLYVEEYHLEVDGYSDEENPKKKNSFFLSYDEAKLLGIHLPYSGIRIENGGEKFRQELKSIRYSDFITEDNLLDLCKSRCKERIQEEKRKLETSQMEILMDYQKLRRMFSEMDEDDIWKIAVKSQEGNYSEADIEKLKCLLKKLECLKIKKG